MRIFRRNTSPRQPESTQKERLEAFEKDETGRFELHRKTFQYLYRLELLKENWLYVLMDADKLLYGGLASVYEDSVKSDAEQKGNAIQKRQCNTKRQYSTKRVERNSQRKTLTSSDTL